MYIDSRKQGATTFIVMILHIKCLSLAEFGNGVSQQASTMLQFRLSRTVVRKTFLYPYCPSIRPILRA
jgi:hypothetical protein